MNASDYAHQPQFLLVFGKARVKQHSRISPKGKVGIVHEHERRTGSVIYRIMNTITGETYIGSSIYGKDRLNFHKKALMNGEHYNVHLQRAWKKHGAAAFVFEPIIELDQAVTRTELRKLEQLFMDAYRKYGKPIYNFMPSAHSETEMVYHHTDEAKRKMSQVHTGKDISQKQRDENSRHQKELWRDPEYRAAATQRSKERANRPEEIERHRRQMLGNQNLLGHHHTEETREKMRASGARAWESEERHVHQSKVLTEALSRPEVRAKMSAARVGRTPTMGYVFTPEQIANLKAGQVRGWESQERRRKQSLAMKELWIRRRKEHYSSGYIATKETREKISQAKLGKKFTTEHREHLREGIRDYWRRQQSGEGTEHEN